MKNQYIIKEVQNLNSERKGTKIEVTSLLSAKRTASKMQCFQGTVMRIESLNGVLLSYKEYNKSWVDCY